MRRLLVGLLFCLAAGILEGQEYAGQKTLSEKNPPDLTGILVDYSTSQVSATVLAAPCASAGPPTWKILCAETMVALGGTLSTVTPAASDSVFIIQSGVLKLAAVSDFGGTTPLLSTTKSICQGEMFFNAAGNPHGTCFASGTTANTGAISTLAAVAANEPGLTRCLVTAAADKCSFGTTVNSPSSVFFGGGVVRYTAKVSFTTTSDDSANDYTWRGGFSDDNSGATDGVYLLANDDVNSSEFQLVCIKASVSTTIDTNQAIPYAGAAPNSVPSFHLLEIEVNADGTSAQFYYDGVAAGLPCTTNIPVTAANATGLLVGGTVGGTGGTGDTYTDYAYFSYVWQFTTPR